MAYYVEIVDGVDNVWGVRIPDFPGCCSGGATADEAVANAISALRDYAADMVASGEMLPEPRSLEAIAQLNDAVPHRMLVAIPLIREKGRAVRTNIVMDEGLLEAVREAAQRRGETQSEFVASAVRDKIEEHV